MEEQIALNREEVEIRTSSTAHSENEEDGFSAKRPRGETMPCLAENSSQEAGGASEGVAGASWMASSSSLSSMTELMPTRFLWTQKIPTLYRFALERLMRLPVADPVFRDGLPIQLATERINPYQNSIKEMIQTLHKACQKYSLYRRPSEIKKREPLILFKQKLQASVADCMEKLRTKNYSQAIFEIEFMMQVIPDLRIAVDSFIEREEFKHQADLLEHDGNVEKSILLKSALPVVAQRAQIALLFIKAKKQIGQLLLGEPSVDEVTRSQQSLAHQEKQLARVTSLSNQQKLFLERAEEFTPAKREKIKGFFHNSLQALKTLEAVFQSKDENEIQFFERQLNGYDHVIKVSLSTDSRVNRIQEKIVNGYERLMLLDLAERNANIEKSRLIEARAQRLTTFQDGSQQVKGESYAPIFELYQMPISFLEREISLLQRIKEDLLAARPEMSVCKLELAKSWDFLAREAASTINALSQLGIMQAEENLLTQAQRELLAFLNQAEDQLATGALSFRVDQDMAPLPWNFEETFEKNVEALPSEEEL